MDIYIKYMYILEFPNLFFAIHFQNTNTAMDNAIGSPIFTQTISRETVTNLKKKIFNAEEFKIYTKAKSY